MPELNTSELGTLAELRFQLRCVERGIECFSPVINSNKAVDYVIRLQGELVSVQVKKATEFMPVGRNPAPRIKAALHVGVHPYARVEGYTCPIDYYAFVCLERNSMWLIPKSEVPQTGCWNKRIGQLSELDPYLF